MSDITPTENKKPSSLARYVRLSPEEHAQLLKDELLSGKSAQELMKTAYFEKGPVVLLMAEADKNTFMTLLSRIGNNVNQIAKKLNTGIVYGFDEDLSQVRNLVTLLMKWVTTKYYLNRNKEETR